MCGITGVLSIHQSLPAFHIQRATRILRHRGPDDEGYLGIHPASGTAVPFGGPDSRVELPDVASAEFSARIWLGHRRLAIIDTSAAGHQPMASADGKKWLVYNGEIYNYRELRQELGQAGCVFSSRTDSEVILAAYEKWGEGCLQRFNGMWALAILDMERKCLFLARDRMGIKPLYFFRDKDYFVFASEIKSILTYPFVAKKINREVVFDYLALGYEDREDETAFKNIYELPPAQHMTLRLGDHRCDLKKYYELDFQAEPRPLEPGKLPEYSRDLLELLVRSIRLRLHSDVPLGSCLSGGIDSSAIVCLVSGILRESPVAAVGDRQKVFTACFPGQAIDESGYAKIVAAKAGAAWHPVVPQAGEMAHDLADLVYCQELPFGSTSIYAQYRIMKAVRQEGIKVLLDGQGGDELFGGYRQFFPPYYHELLTHFLWHELGMNVRGIAHSPFGASYLLKGVFKNIAKKITPAAIKNFARKKIAEKNGLLNEEFSRACQHRYQRGIEFEFFSLNEMLGSYMTGFHLKSLLRYEDRNSMRFAIESRTPFADDNDLIAFMFQIPAAYKIHQGWSKFLLRRTLAGSVPEPVLWRRDKIAFATPEASWLRQIKNELRFYASGPYQDFIDIKKLAENWDSLFCALPDSGFSQLWRVINFLIWAKTFDL